MTVTATKKVHPVFLFLFLVFLSFPVFSKVTIRGKIISYDGKSLVYYHTTQEGIYTPYWMELKPNNNGLFKIEFENEGFGNTTVSYKGLHYRFFHDGNSQIYVEFNGVTEKRSGKLSNENIYAYKDSVKQAKTIKIEGDYQAINLYYNRNMRGSYSITRSVSGNDYSYMIRKAETPDLAMAVFDSLRQIELEQISRLPLAITIETPGQEKKEKEIRDFLTSEVNTFYTAIFLNAMFLRRSDHVTRLINDPMSAPNIYNREWEMLIEKMYADVVANLPPVPNSSTYNDFIEAMSYTMSDYQKYDFPQNFEKSIDETVINKLFNYDTVLIHDDKSRLSYELGALQLYLNDQLFYSPILLHAVYELQDRYPSSINMKHYQPLVEKLKTSLEKSQSEFTSAKIIEANYNSFASLLKRFSGKNVLIDVWATWCHPCIEEFKHKEILKPFLENGQLEVLYISIDKKQWEDRWRQSIKINELAGFHFRAEEKFIIDMWSTIGDFEGAIPRYALIDKEGNIFKSTAARPSDGIALTEQIDTLIKGQ